MPPFASSIVAPPIPTSKRSDGDVVTLNVGGRRFQTTRQTLALAGAASLLADPPAFIDRDPNLFSLLLSLLRTNRLPSSPDHPISDLIAEAGFYGIDPSLLSNPSHFDAFDLAKSQILHLNGRDYPSAIATDPSGALHVAHGGKVTSFDWSLSKKSTVLTRIPAVDSLLSLRPSALLAAGAVDFPGLHIIDLTSPAASRTLHWNVVGSGSAVQAIGSSPDHLFGTDQRGRAAAAHPRIERERERAKKEKEKKRMWTKGGGDARSWDEEGYRSSIILERELRSRTVFRAAFAPSPNPNPETLAVASSDGSLTVYSIPSCIAASQQNVHSKKKIGQELVVGPLCIFQGHKGPAYDLKFYGNGHDSLLLSCGDDGHIRGWKWMDVLNSEMSRARQGSHLNPMLDFVNPQHEGPWGALSPIPESNAIAINEQDGSIFSAAGDSCAYCWDVETGKIKVVFKGHSDYLHCIITRKSNNQVITGSEDGTTRIWDCRSGRCTQVIHPEKGYKSKEPSWVSCLAIDASESWLVCGTGTGLSGWSLLSCESIFSIDSRAPTQDILFDDNHILAAGSEPLLTRYSMSGTVLSQIQCAPQSVFSVCLHPSGVTAVGGYGGMLDVISQFGSHLCTFCCSGNTNA